MDQILMHLVQAQCFLGWQKWIRNCKAGDGATRILSGILGQSIVERMGIILMPSNHPKIVGLELLSKTLYCLRCCFSQLSCLHVETLINASDHMTRKWRQMVRQ